MESSFLSIHGAARRDARPKGPAVRNLVPLGPTNRHWLTSLPSTISLATMMSAACASIEAIAIPLLFTEMGEASAPIYPWRLVRDRKLVRHHCRTSAHAAEKPN